MKTNKLLIIFAVLIAVLLTFSGCASLMRAFENQDIRAYTETVIDSILADDVDSAYAIFEDICTLEDFSPVFSEMRGLVENVESYELKLLNINQKVNMINGSTVTEISSVYEMTANGERYIVDVKASSLYAKLSSFYISPYENTNYYSYGTVTNMKGASAFQWAFLLSNLVVIGLMTFALVDCCRHKVRLKALWIIIIIIGLFSVGATISQSNINLNLNLGWLTAYTALIHYGGGTTVVRFVIPIGAVAYFIARHWIIRRPAPEPEPAPVLEYAPAEAYSAENKNVPVKEEQRLDCECEQAERMNEGE